MLQISERIGKLLEYINQQIYTEIKTVNNFKIFRTAERLNDLSRLDTSTWTLYNKEQLEGGNSDYYWFETTIEIDEQYKDKCVVFEINTSRDSLWDKSNPQLSIYVNGKLIQGLDINHRSIILSEKARVGDRYKILLSAFTGTQEFALFLSASLKILHREVEKYYYDISVPYNVALLLENNDINKILILKALNNSLNLLDLRKEGSILFYESLKNAQQNINDFFYDKYYGEQAIKVYCVGHTHIDCAWLWTLKMTEDKTIRSFSTVLNLMNQYPEYTFMSSQPQLYKFVKNIKPEVFEEIRKRVSENRWEVDGGMFVEADCNLISGESLIRQFIHGQQFFKKEFNKTNEILWLPDVFGYSAALPQIIKKCGLSYFMTTKISWNEFNKMPYDTFEWEGIDGTKVLTHFVPTRDYNKGAVEGSEHTSHFTTYNGYINPRQIKGGWERYSQKDLNNEILCCYGFGDGGGGPTKDMLENQRRLEMGIPGCPQTINSNAKEFFHVLEKSVKDSKYLPKWVGELYLEYHRGTYTSMARNKKYNRKAEFAYSNLECFATLVNELFKKPYPSDKIYEAWEVILKNQFHDILPGSSIFEVYEESQKEYKKIFKIYNELMSQTLNIVVESINAKENSLIVFNPNSFKYNGLVELNDLDSTIYNNYFNNLVCQKIKSDSYLIDVKDIPSKGYCVVENKPCLNSDNLLEVSKERIENNYFIIEFNDKGQFSSIHDKRENREILKKGEFGNVLMSYEDRPHNYDAWDVNKYYDEKKWEINDIEKWEIIEKGPLRACIMISRKYLDSYITQYIYVYRDYDRIDIKNVIDWKEHQIFLKAWFPLDIHTQEATFDIQYGNVKRNTHNNTSWDYAQFEVCVHKWLDVSEAGFGVSFINDCKYGCSVKDRNVGLSLLKSGIFPNPKADQEIHEFTYSIYPHNKGWRDSELIKNAYEINNPVIPIIKENNGGILDNNYSFVTSDKDNVIIEVVKESLDNKAKIIRLYECYNMRSSSVLTFGKNVIRAVDCDMMENEIKDLEVYKNNKVKFDIKPYEIKTIKIFF